MSFTALLPQTVTVVRYTAGAENEYGNPEQTVGTSTAVRGRLEQLTSRENDLDRATVVDRWRLYLPAGTSIHAGDEVLEGGRTFRVDGTPEVVYGATSPHHVEALLVYASDLTLSAAAGGSNLYDTAVYDTAVYA